MGLSEEEEAREIIQVEHFYSHAIHADLSHIILFNIKKDV